MRFTLIRSRAQRGEAELGGFRLESLNLSPDSRQKWHFKNEVLCCISSKNVKLINNKVQKQNHQRKLRIDAHKDVQMRHCLQKKYDANCLSSFPTNNVDKCSTFALPQCCTKCNCRTSWNSLLPPSTTTMSRLVVLHSWWPMRPHWLNWCLVKLPAASRWHQSRIPCKS